MFNIQVLNTGMKEQALVAGTDVLTVNFDFQILDENGATYSVLKTAEILFYRPRDATGITIGSIQKFQDDDTLDITVVDLAADGKSNLQDTSVELIEISPSSQAATSSGLKGINSELSDKGGGIFKAELNESFFSPAKRTNKYVVIARYGTDEYSFKQKR